MKQLPDRDDLLTRDETAVALTAAGYPIRSATLGTKATRGGGPPFRGSELVLFIDGVMRSIGPSTERLSRARSVPTRATLPPQPSPDFNGSRENGLYRAARWHVARDSGADLNAGRSGHREAHRKLTAAELPISLILVGKK